MEVFLDKLGLYKQVEESPGPPQPLMLEGVDLLGRGRLKFVFISYFFFLFLVWLYVVTTHPTPNVKFTEM